jgi:hypothetical protein
MNHAAVFERIVRWIANFDVRENESMKHATKKAAKKAPAKKAAAKKKKK